MSEEKELSLAEEAGLPENWIPTDSKIPGAAQGSAPQAPPATDKYFSGTLSPSLQHDVSFVGTQTGMPRVPNFPLMPLGPSGSAALNSAIKSVIGPPKPTPVTSKGMVWKGDWVSTSAYAKFDVVQYNSSTYLALQGNGGQVPTGGAPNWVVVSENFVFKGQWENNTPVSADGPGINFVDQGVFTGSSGSGFGFSIPWSQNPALQTWAAVTSYPQGARLIDSNGNTQVATTPGISEATFPPVWSTTLGGFTTDGTVVWTLRTIGANAINVGDVLLLTATTDDFFNGVLNGVSGVSDTLGNVWHELFNDDATSAISGRPWSFQTFYAVSVGAVANGGAYTVTLAGGPNTPNVLTILSGVSNVGVNDQTTNASAGGTTTLAPGPITTTGPSSIFYFSWTESSGSTPAGFTNLTFNSGAEIINSYWISTAVPGTYNSSTTQTTSRSLMVAQTNFLLTSPSPYLPYDVVEYLGSFYVCINPTVQLPTDTSDWAQIAQGIGSVRFIAADYAPSLTDNGLLVANSGTSALTVTLPAPPALNSWTLFVQNSGTGSTTIDPNGLLLDGGASTLTLAGKQGVIIFTDGVNYFSVRGIGGTILLETNGSPNGDQSKLNLAAGTGISLADDGFGNVTITNSGSAPTQFNQSIKVDTTIMSDDYWISVDSGAYDQALPLAVM